MHLLVCSKCVCDEEVETGDKDVQDGDDCKKKPFLRDHPSVFMAYFTFSQCNVLLNIFESLGFGVFKALDHIKLGRNDQAGNKYLMSAGV